MHAHIYTCIYCVFIMYLHNTHSTDHDGHHHPQPYIFQCEDPRGNPILSLPLDKHTVLVRVPRTRQFLQKRRLFILGHSPGGFQVQEHSGWYVFSFWQGQPAASRGEKQKGKLAGGKRGKTGETGEAASLQLSLYCSWLARARSHQEKAPCPRLSHPLPTSSIVTRRSQESNP